MNHTPLLFIFTLLMLPGIAGVVLPVIPGLPYMFIVALVFGIVDGFRHLSALELGGLFFIVLASVAVDFFSGVLGAKYGGAARRSIFLGFLGLIVGMIVFPPFGGIIGMFLAVLLSEITGSQDQRRAFRAATGSVIGYVAGTILSLILALIFLGCFVWFAWR